MNCNKKTKMLFVQYEKQGKCGRAASLFFLRFSLYLPCPCDTKQTRTISMKCIKGLKITRDCFAQGVSLKCRVARARGVRATQTTGFFWILKLFQVANIREVWGEKQIFFRQNDDFFKKSVLFGKRWTGVYFLEYSTVYALLCFRTWLTFLIKNSTCFRRAKFLLST